LNRAVYCIVVVLASVMYCVAIQKDCDRDAHSPYVVHTVRLPPSYLPSCCRSDRVLSHSPSSAEIGGRCKVSGSNALTACNIGAQNVGGHKHVAEFQEPAYRWQRFHRFRRDTKKGLCLGEITEDRDQDQSVDRCRYFRSALLPSRRYCSAPAFKRASQT
jgi:hypothetical protein